MNRLAAARRRWPALAVGSLIVASLGIVSLGRAAVPGVAPAAAPAEVHRHAYWNGKVVNLEDFRVVRALPGEPGSLDVQDARDVWRVVEGRRLEGVRLLDGSPLREFGLRGPCRWLLMDERNVFAVLDEAVESFPRDRAYGAQQVLFPGHRAHGAALLRPGLAVLLEDTSVHFVDGVTNVSRRLMEQELSRVMKRRGVRLIAAPHAGLVCRLEILDTDFHVRCVDGNGTPHWEGGQRHTVVTPEGAVRELTLPRVGAGHLLFGSPPGAKPRTVVFSSSNGERLLDLERLPGGLVEGPDGTLVGLLVPQSARGGLTMLTAEGEPSWSIEVCEGRTAVAALLVGDRLVVSCWDRADSGGELFAVAAATGERVWKAEVARLGRPRGDYTNQIELRVDRELVFLEGHESALQHVQVFELSGGARRYVDARHKW
jgi:hypothetical protein